MSENPSASTLRIKVSGSTKVNDMQLIYEVNELRGYTRLDLAH
jgi:hypothetical protein